MFLAAPLPLCLKIHASNLVHACAFIRGYTVLKHGINFSGQCRRPRLSETLQATKLMYNAQHAFSIYRVWHEVFVGSNFCDFAGFFFAIRKISSRKKEKIRKTLFHCRMGSTNVTGRI